MTEGNDAASWERSREAFDRNLLEVASVQGLPLPQMRDCLARDNFVCSCEDWSRRGK